MKYLLFSVLFLLACNKEDPNFKNVLAEVGKTAPDFKLKGHDGQEYSLSQFKGKTVVLEWLNHGCPFVKKHYNSGNMQKLQDKYTKQDVVWLSIISSAEGKQGHVDAESATRDKNELNSSATAVLLDASGNTGRTYGAKTTPHMYVVNKEGMLVYNGAIDDKPSTQISDVNGARNFVAQALDSLIKGEEVDVSSTKPYGCSVKY